MSLLNKTHQSHCNHWQTYHFVQIVHLKCVGLHTELIELPLDDPLIRRSISPRSQNAESAENRYCSRTISTWLRNASLSDLTIENVSTHVSNTILCCFMLCWRVPRRSTHHVLFDCRLPQKLSLCLSYMHFPRALKHVQRQSEFQLT